jgi:hypothetical protein
MYSGDLIKDLLETVAQAEALTQAPASSKLSSTEGQHLARDRAAQEFTARKVPAAVSSEPG